ncbi:uncharacterized protein LOC109609016 [Aethina tumida]|uniref:uncharacterized protein LOC109609016 n=1 Tax=Aethina tumida TaxID=116153 RepID=UPI0021485222|nr:uncharacterized protein LOC109609016 [Aethina tumida]
MSLANNLTVDKLSESIQILAESKFIFATQCIQMNTDCQRLSYTEEEVADEEKPKENVFVITENVFDPKHEHKGPRAIEYHPFIKSGCDKETCYQIWRLMCFPCLYMRETAWRVCENCNESKIRTLKLMEDRHTLDCCRCFSTM